MNFEHMTDEEMNIIAKNSGIEIKRELDNELRDWFAGKALQGNLEFFEDNDVADYNDVANNCYKLADAMMKARDKS